MASRVVQINPGLSRVIKCYPGLSRDVCTDHQKCIALVTFDVRLWSAMVVLIIMAGIN